MGVPAGPWHIDDLLTFTVVTHKVDTGVLTDADSVPTYRIYEDETGTAILTGSTAKLDDTNTTGFYSEQITLSAANGFENGKSYSIYIAATVNSIVGGQTFNFKVDAATLAAIADAVWDEDLTGHVTNDTAGKQLDYAADTVFQIDAKTANLPSDPADASDVAASFGAVNSTLATMAGYIDTEVAAIKAKTDNLTFTVAGQVDANLQYVNDVLVTGNGQPGTPWGP